MTPAAKDAKNGGLGRIEVLHNTDNIIHTYLQALYNTKGRWDYCADIKALSKFFEIKSIKKALLDAKERRNIIIRFITEITSDNFPYCKEIMKIGKVRHLDGVKGNFGISDTEYISTANPIGSEPIISYAIYSNVKEDLLQQHYIFDILWNTAIPAERRIREIEEGIERVETIALEDSTKIVERIKKNLESSNEIKICFQPGGLQLIYNNFLEPYKRVLDAYKKGHHKGIRCITTVNRDNEELATLFLNLTVK